MIHVSPAMLVASATGTLEGKPLRAVTKHILLCELCRSKQSNILKAQDAMRTIRDLPAPDLNWDSIATRVYWTTSSEARNASEQLVKSRGLWGYGVGGMILVVATLLLFLQYRTNIRTSVATIEAKKPSYREATMPVSVNASSDIKGLVTFIQGDVQHDKKNMQIEQSIVKGQGIHTGTGQLIVQFEEQSAFRLARYSELHVQKFSSKRIELAIKGSIDVEIARRSPEQEVVIVAGNYRVTVRGTAFRVKQDTQELEVICTRGKVVVSDGIKMVSVSAGQRLIVQGNEPVTTGKISFLDQEEMLSMEQGLEMPMLPTWRDYESARLASTFLEVSSSSNSAVAVDGERVASGSFSLRVMTGRHQIASIDPSGSLYNAVWVQGDSLASVTAHLQPRKKRMKTKVNVRKNRRHRQLQSLMENSKSSFQCVSGLEKQRLLTGSFVSFNVGINSDGTQAYLNLNDSNLSHAVVGCLRNAVERERLDYGNKAEFTLTLSF